MAGSMTTSGTEELSRQLSTLGNQAGHIAARGLYEGAAVVADAYKAAVSQIQTAPRRHREGDTRLPTPEEKAALMGATGIAKFRGSGGEIDTIIGEPEGYGVGKGRRKALKPAGPVHQQRHKLYEPAAGIPESQQPEPGESPAGDGGGG